MFSSSRSLKKIRCPLEDDECKLPFRCPFSHDNADAAETSRLQPKHDSAKRQSHIQESYKKPLDNSNKRRRLNSKSSDEPDAAKSKSSENSQGVSVARRDVNRRSISPPPLTRETRQSKASEDGQMPRSPAPTVKNESLFPRAIPKPPAQHNTRALFLRKLHENFTRLNSALSSAEDNESKSLHLSDGQLISLALDEEEKPARDSPSVYGNVIKLRLAALSKMTTEQWISERKTKIIGGSAQAKPAEIEFAPNLPPSREISVLRHLVAGEKARKKYGFLTSVPTDSEIAKAKDGVITAMGWEVCERCKSRFDVTSSPRVIDKDCTGIRHCSYHPGKIQYPEDPNMGEKKFTCCDAPLGSSIGCSSSRSHVFKVDDGARLAMVCQFQEAPENPNAYKAVSFDCEMGYTVNGMELMRLTVLSWPEGKLLLDVLNWPVGLFLDFNSRFSGVLPEDYGNAVPHGTPIPHSKGRKRLELVKSPMAARELLFKLISPSTILVGHSLENDLNATRIVHHNIVDSSILYPHKRGAPYRHALKKLANEVLGREIQANVDGHDPQEDAKTAGDLVRRKVAKQWNHLQKEGWTFLDKDSDELVPPPDHMEKRKP